MKEVSRCQNSGKLPAFLTNIPEILVSLVAVSSGGLIVLPSQNSLREVAVRGIWFLKFSNRF